MALMRLRYIIIPVLCVFLMSHNANAIELITDVDLVMGNQKSQIKIIDGSARSYSGGTACIAPVINSWYDEIGCTTGFYRIYKMGIKIPSRTYAVGDWIAITLYTFGGSDSTSEHSRFNGIAYGGSNGIDLLSVTENQFNSNSSQVNLYLRVYSSFNDSNLTFYGTNGAYGIYDVSAGTDAGGYLRVGTVSVFHETSETNYTSTLNTISSRINNVNTSVNNVKNSVDNVQHSVDDLNSTIEEQNEKENQSIDNIDGQDASDIQGTDNQNTTNLITLFGNFVNAVKNASPTNCNITGDLGLFDMGTLNLCRDNPPTYIQVIGSIILIALFIPMAYFLINRIIAEIRSFTNG